MIATILQSSASFNGIDYNEEKVKRGDAEIIEMKNINGLAALPGHTPQELKDFFIEYSSRNTRIEKPQFHVAFSIKGGEMSHQQILDFAHRWLKEMGYGEEGQPLVVYAHHDTDNNHIHIITSRINPKGQKIDHSMERKRGRAVLERLLGMKKERNLDDKINQVLNSYRFSSVKQCMAIFETSGYDVYEDKDTGKICLSREGEKKGEISSDDIISRLHKDKTPDDRKQAWRAKAILTRVAGGSSTMEEFVNSARKKYGLGIVLLGKKDAPYGYMVVDHKNKVVFNGSSQVMKLGELTALFVPNEERILKAKEYVSTTIAENPKITTRELNFAMVAAVGVKISKGNLVAGSLRESIDPELLGVLKVNDKRAWVQSFNPSNEIEREIVCRLTGWKDVEEINIVGKTLPDDSQMEIIKKACEEYKETGVWELLAQNKMAMAWKDDGCFIIDYANRTITNVTELGLVTSEDRVSLAENIIKNTLEKDPYITTRDLNKELSKITGGKISKGILTVGSISVPLRPADKDQLYLNDKVSWVEGFNPKNELERDILCKKFNIDPVERVRISYDGKDVDKTLSGVSEIFANTPTGELKEALENAGYQVAKNGGRWYCIDTRNETIVDLTEFEFDTSALEKANNKVQPMPNAIRQIASALRGDRSGGKGSARGNKRDWEVKEAGEYSLDDKPQSNGLSM